MEKGQLKLTKGETTLVFDPSVAADAPLIGTAWQLSSIEVEGPNSGIGSGASYSGVVLTITAAGRYQVTTSNCISYVGSAQVSGRTVLFSNQHQDSTHLSCGTGVSIQLAQLLHGSVNWWIHDKQLTLTKGGTTATFTS